MFEFQFILGMFLLALGLVINNAIKVGGGINYVTIFIVIYDTSLGDAIALS